VVAALTSSCEVHPHTLLPIVEGKNEKERPGRFTVERVTGPETLKPLDPTALTVLSTPENPG